MSYTDYAGLTGGIIDWAGDRSDLASRIDGFISLAEADFNRILRTREMETVALFEPGVNTIIIYADDTQVSVDSTDITVDGGLTSPGGYALPDDYLEWRTVTAMTSPRRSLEYVTPGYVEDNYPNREAGNPLFFTVYGDAIEVVPYTTSQIRLLYYSKIPAISATRTTNWLLTKAPGLYLFQVSAYAATFLKDANEAQKFFGLASAEMEKMVAADLSSRWSRAARRSTGVRP